jgi:hypothetical protein
MVEAFITTLAEVGEAECSRLCGPQGSNLRYTLQVGCPVRESVCACVYASYMCVHPTVLKHVTYVRPVRVVCSCAGVLFSLFHKAMSTGPCCDLVHVIM